MTYPADDITVPNHPIDFDFDQVATDADLQNAGAAYYAAYGLSVCDDAALLLATIIARVSTAAAAEIVHVLADVEVSELLPDQIAADLVADAGLYTDEGRPADDHRPTPVERRAIYLWGATNRDNALYPDRWRRATPGEREAFLAAARADVIAHGVAAEADRLLAETEPAVQGR